MWISEIFYSIQGEGSLLGVPSVFIRTSGCNLRCEWCDTKYASWEPTGDHLSSDEIIEQVSLFPCTHVVITGGEPMIEKDLPLLTKKLKDHDKHITIETAATIFDPKVQCDLASLSPKLSNSTPIAISDSWRKKHEERRQCPQVVEQWANHTDYQLKFVINEKCDIEEMQQTLKLYKIKIPLYKIFLMPQGTDEISLKQKSLWLVEECKKYGFSYTPRTHVDLFGSKRGV